MSNIRDIGVIGGFVEGRVNEGARFHLSFPIPEDAGGEPRIPNRALDEVLEDALNAQDVVQGYVGS